MTIQLFKSLPVIHLKDDTEEKVFYRYDFKKGLWISNIAIKNRQIVINSNHFMQSYQNMQEYGVENRRKAHFIYTRIKEVYNISINDISNNNFIEINDKCICLHNSFSTGNAGHDLLYILDTLTKYLHKTEVKFVIFDEINEEDNNNMYLIKLLIDNNRLITIKKDTTYKFNRLIFNYEKGVYCMSDYKNLIDKIRTLLLDKINEKYSIEELETFKNKKVILIKHDKMNCIVRKDDMFNANELYKCVSNNKDYYIANPETDEYYKFTYILLNASKIISAQQGISCANQIYYNNNIEVIGFLPGENRLSIGQSNINYDMLCNSLYFNRMKRLIRCPLIIKKEDFDILNRVI